MSTDYRGIQVLSRFLVALCVLFASLGQAQTVAEARNMRLVGMHDLQGRSSYQPVVHRYGERYVLVVGHHAGTALNPHSGERERSGASLLDVTDPSAPELLVHIPPTGPDANGTQHVQVCSGVDLPAGDASKTYLLRTNGQEGVEILDISDPREPSLLTTVARTGVTDLGDRETHKSQWDCATGLAYLNLTADGWRVPRILQVFDLSDPAEPRFIRDFGLEDWRPGASGADPDAAVSGLHQPMVVADRMYLGYGSGNDGVLQIVDREKFLRGDPDASEPFAPTAANLAYPVIAELKLPRYWGVHTAKPVYGLEVADYAGSPAAVRDFLIVVSETTQYRCQQERDVMFLFDITEEDRPFPVSTFQVPEEPGDFCNRGGRFGPHAPHDLFDERFDRRIVALSYFNAGVRVVDIRNPFELVEIAHYIPAMTSNTMELCIEIDGAEECTAQIQTNNVNLDDRGLVYAVDRAGTGLHVLELTGEARAIAGL